MELAARLTDIGGQKWTLSDRLRVPITPYPDDINKYLWKFPMTIWPYFTTLSLREEDYLVIDSSSIDLVTHFLDESVDQKEEPQPYTPAEVLNVVNNFPSYLAVKHSGAYPVLTEDSLIFPRPDEYSDPPHSNIVAPSLRNRVWNQVQKLLTPEWLETMLPEPLFSKLVIHEDYVAIPGESIPWFSDYLTRTFPIYHPTPKAAVKKLAQFIDKRFQYNWIHSRAEDSMTIRRRSAKEYEQLLEKVERLDGVVIETGGVPNCFRYITLWNPVEVYEVLWERFMLDPLAKIHASLELGSVLPPHLRTVVGEYISRKTTRSLYHDSIVKEVVDVINDQDIPVQGLRDLIRDYI